ncbi:MAG: methionyl-tRNA formyltransferase [Saprospiraceae bacterium]|nr:methionyl-tRNA formyltransferase [Saprospiraceae bacterium]
MGTPEFAVPSLKILLDHGYEIPAVVTAVDKPGGRKGMQQSAIKSFAMERGIPVLQPEKLKNPEFIEALRAYQADLQVVVAFRMLPQVVWNMPHMGTLNLHGSLLPNYRGAAPINWAIINGEKETGVTTFLLQHEIDTGDLLFQKKITIGENETAGELHDRMMEVGAQLVLQTVQALEAGKAQPKPQSNMQASYAPKIHTETCKINFSAPSSTVHNFIRGLSPYPGAWTMLGDKTFKILRTVVLREHRAPELQGVLYSPDKRTICVDTADGTLQILELQIEGKRRMSAQEFLNGHELPVTSG